MHIVITGGGTGGHVFPAIEIAKGLKELVPRPRITYVGNTGGFEEQMAKNHNLPFFGLSSKPLADRSLFKKLTALVFLGWAVVRSLLFLLKQKPNAVIGVGGYVSAPMVLASFLVGIPRFICEQNAIPGNANKFLGLIAKKVFLGFEVGAKYFPACKCIFSGNPVRPEFFAIHSVKAVESMRILIIGGSQGAHVLNNEVPAALSLIHPECPHLTITHQTGRGRTGHVYELYQQAGLNAQVLDFIENMPKYFARHDLIISRAGAMSCAEILAAGKPAIFVPYRLAGGHQKENARELLEHGASLMVEEGPDFTMRLAQAIKTLYSGINQRDNMAKKARALAKSDAANIIIHEVLKVCQPK